jgi:hypothetical protein
VSVWCGTLQIIKFDTIIYACMVWHITVYSLKKIIKNWGTIICACMVRHSNAQRLLIICCTVVWHSPVLNVLINHWSCYLVNQCLLSLSTQSCWWWLAPLSCCLGYLILSLSGLARFYFRLDKHMSTCTYGYILYMDVIYKVILG